MRAKSRVASAAVGLVVLVAVVVHAVTESDLVAAACYVGVLLGASVGAFGFTTGSKDAAFLQRLNAAYSIQARGTGPGVVLVEAYDTGDITAARLVNVSARNRVGTGDDILIAGFNIAGTGLKQLLIRAVGPKLRDFGVEGIKRFFGPAGDIYLLDWRGDRAPSSPIDG